MKILKKSDVYLRLLNLPELAAPEMCGHSWESLRCSWNNEVTVIIIKPAQDVIRSAGYIVDMGTGDGSDDGKDLASGTSAEIRVGLLLRCLQRYIYPQADRAERYKVMVIIWR